MLNVIFTPSSRKDGSGSCAAALRFSSSYGVGALLNRNSKKVSSAVTFGGDRRIEALDSGEIGAGIALSLPRPASPALPARPAPATADRRGRAELLSRISIASVECAAIAGCVQVARPDRAKPDDRGAFDVFVRVIVMVSRGRIETVADKFHAVDDDVLLAARVFWKQHASAIGELSGSAPPTSTVTRRVTGRL